MRINGNVKWTALGIAVGVILAVVVWVFSAGKFAGTTRTTYIYAGKQIDENKEDIKDLRDRTTKLETNYTNIESLLGDISVKLDTLMGLKQ